MTDNLRTWLEADPQLAERVVEAIASRITAEVGATQGLSGLAIRASLSTLERLRPGFVETAVRALLPECSEVMGRHYRRYLLAGQDQERGGFGGWVEAHAAELTRDVRAVVDTRIAGPAGLLPFPAAVLRPLRQRLEGKLAPSLLRLAGLLDAAGTLRSEA
jgi:hypothetical protein